MKSLFPLALIACCNVAFADTFPTAIAAKAFTDQVMTKVASGDIIGGLTMMKPYTVIPSSEFDTMTDQATLQLPVIAKRFGKPLGKEFLYEQKVGDSLEELVYIEKLEKTAMRWRFFFYRDATGWTINSFKFDDQIDALFVH